MVMFEHLGNQVAYQKVSMVEPIKPIKLLFQHKSNQLFLVEIPQATNNSTPQ